MDAFSMDSTLTRSYKQAITGPQLLGGGVPVGLHEDGSDQRRITCRWSCRFEGDREHFQDAPTRIEFPALDFLRRHPSGSD
jgi:hypothetical protein